MSYIIIDGTRREYASEKNILEIVRGAGIELPALCYHRDLPVSGSCKLCMVEDGEGNFLAACSTPPTEGLRIRTQSEALDKYRKQTLETLLKDHAGDCAACEKSDGCKLKEYALRYGVKDVRFSAPAASESRAEQPENIVRDFDKCVSCGSCVSVCSEIQGIGAISFPETEEVSAKRPAVSEACVECGRCLSVCPTGALTIKNETERAWELLRMDKRTTRVIVQIAPAVRAAIGEYFGLARGEDAMGKIAAALRLIGADVVADGAYGEDLKTLAETEELRLRRNAGENLPLISSFCPAWVRFAENAYPGLRSRLSSCRSSMQTFSAVLRNYYDGLDDGRETKIIAATPCAAAKYEAARAEFAKDGKPETDLVLTTGELVKMFKRAGIRLRLLKNEPCDAPFDVHTGAGLLSAVSGGAAESLVRCLSKDKSREFLRRLEYSGLRGRKEFKEAAVEADGREWKIAVVAGLKAADALMKKIQSGKAAYDFVEVTACPQGCIAGPGQPCIDEMTEKLRAAGLCYADRKSEQRSSQENSAAADLYEHLSAKEKHEFLHVNYAAAEVPEEPAATEILIGETPEELPDADEPEDILEEEAPLEELFEEPASAEEEIALAEAPFVEAIEEESQDETPELEELPVADETIEPEAVCAPEERETEDMPEPESEPETEPAPEPEEEPAPAPETETEIIPETPEEIAEDAEEEAEEESAAPANEAAEPYHTTLSRKERRKLKRMKKFRR